MNLQITIFFWVLLLAACGNKLDESLKYLKQTPPSITPEIFAPDYISKKTESEFVSVFNADATEFFYGVDVNGKEEIRYSKLIGSSWSEPETFLVHDKYGYNDPFLSPNENKLFFISRRTLDGVGEPADYDIWYIERLDSGWSEPINAGQNINSSKNEYYISFTNDNTMYFSSNKIGSNFDIYTSKFVDGKFQKPIPLDNTINTPDYEADVFIDPAEKYIIYCSIKEDGLGRGDLYISFKDTNGKWQQPISMGDQINTSKHELCPFVSKDGKFLFYTSNQDIYWVSTKIIDELKTKRK